jgi:mono/diheme cytochrome c family protein
MLPKSTLLQSASLGLLLGVMTLVTACGKTDVTLNGQEDALAAKSVTASNHEVVYPDATPSTADGKIVWDKAQCASCHGQGGVGGSAKINLADQGWARKQKPVEQYEFLYFGKPGVEHPKVADVMTRREAWNLVFYTRSLADPQLTDDQISSIDAVFGSNCAVCHGKKGYGDGPLAKNLEPSPANFQNKTRFYDRSDDVLWDHIANGIKWEGMPNFLGKEDKAKNVKFDEAYIWNLVQYVRHFNETTVPTVAQNINEGGSNAAPKPTSPDKSPSK